MTTTSLQASLFEVNVLSALRAWHEGLPSRQAVERYLPERLGAGHTARGVIGKIRRELAGYARARFRLDLAEVFERPADQRVKDKKATQDAIEEMRNLPMPMPLIGDDIEQWLPTRAVAVLKVHGIRTLADLTVRMPRRKQWWAEIPGLGPAHAKDIEAFFAANPGLMERARALIDRDAAGDIVPLERQRMASMLDGSNGAFRAPRATSMLSAANDLQAVHVWLQLHEAAATQRAYKKEAERLILWSVYEMGKPISSLTTDDAIAYRAFLRSPTPEARWVGKARSRDAIDWKPFTGPLSSNSMAYALSVLGALFRWLIDKQYLLANPFSGIKVRGADEKKAFNRERAFTEAEWNLIRVIADGLAHSYGWAEASAQRAHFLLDFGYATGLRSSELVGVTLKQLKINEDGDWWLEITGKGAKKRRVAVPPLAAAALNRYLTHRGLPVSSILWMPSTPIVANLEKGTERITGARLWAITHKFFTTAADVLSQDSPALAEKLRRASPHWMRHTHATHALKRGAELTSVRDNLGHANITTTSTYLHGDEYARAKQMAGAFAVRE